jgi:hypothetical protein
MENLREEGRESKTLRYDRQLHCQGRKNSPGPCLLQYSVSIRQRGYHLAMQGKMSYSS